MGGVAEFVANPPLAFGKFTLNKASDVLSGGTPDGPTVFNPRKVTAAERDRLLSEFDKTGGKSVTGDIFLGDNQDQVTARLKQLRSDYETSLSVPELPPDPSAEIIRRAMANERRRQASLSGSGATALTGPAGLPSLPTLRPPRAGGY